MVLMSLPREPQRRTDEQRRRHLDAHEVPLERALLARAAAIQDATGDEPSLLLTQVYLAGEFRALAAELHHW
jgi:hypothetical protein